MHNGVIATILILYERRATRYMKLAGGEQFKKDMRKIETKEAKEFWW